jgi:hypothetical protein
MSRIDPKRTNGAFRLESPLRPWSPFSEVARSLQTGRTIGHTREGADPKELGDELVSRALSLDPNYAKAHNTKGNILAFQKPVPG